MNRKFYSGILALVASILVFSTLTFLTGCSSSSHTTTPPVVTIAATSGGNQTAQVDTAFTNPLVATVMTGTTPASGVTVTFTAPAATDGMFADGGTPAVTDAETTNASGVATSTVFTAGSAAGTYTVKATVTGAAAPANFSLTNTAGAAANLAATGGTPQNVVTGATAASLVAQVTDGDGNGVAGVSVTFTAPLADPSGTFTSTGTNTETVTTDANGNATAADFVAGAIGGPYDVVASSTGLTAVNFVLTNTAVVAAGTNYVFYVSGQELINAGPLYYAIAGAVTVNADGTVAGGEQDYNDAAGITSPTGGDSITGGTLTVDGPTGQGTLTLITNNAHVGVAGTETFGVQFANTKHALIVQFDGTATSSGSMDLQTLGAPSGGYAFTLSGVDPTYTPIAIGGVFSISGAALTNGIVDANDDGAVLTNTPFTANVIAADTFGRGTITGAFAFGSEQVALTYYIVGPEVMRVIDVDLTDSLVGSAFGQGAAAFSNASLGSSVLAIAGNPFQNEYGALGQFSTNTTAATFTGVGDANELDNGILSALASPMSGTYSIASNGYGSLTITGGLGGGHISALGMYMTDPALNLNDPNNTSGGGGALVLDMAASLSGGTGVLTPQTDTATASFANSYAVGWQDFNYFNVGCPDCELDIIAQATVTAGVLSGTGDVSDPFLTLGLAGTGLYSGSTIAATPLADSGNPGRYSMLSTNTPANPLTITVTGTAETPGVVMYQASGGQLFWLNYDTSDTSEFLGPLEQQGSLAGLPAAKKPAAKAQTKQKR